MFLASTVLLGILLLLLIYCNVVLFTYHPPTRARPLDVALIHGPIRLFLILPLMLLFPYSLLYVSFYLPHTRISANDNRTHANLWSITYSVTLGHAWDPAHEDHYRSHQWEGFGVILGVNLLGLIIVAVRRDIVWCVGATWINVAIWATKLKPAPVYVRLPCCNLPHSLMTSLVNSEAWL